MKIFLDMDGVQADFFGTWAKYHRVMTYKETSEHDFERFSRMNHDHIRDFFANLPRLYDGAISTWLLDRNIPFTVLSAPLRNEGAEPSVIGKKMWLQKYLPDHVDTAIFNSKKYLYATDNGKPCLLIDDFGPYVKSWIEHGGIAIKHDSLEGTLAQLNTLYERHEI